MNEYYLNLGILVCIYLILAQSFNLSFGLARLFNLAHIAVFAVGAYATALLSKELEFDVWRCLLVSSLLGGGLTLILGGIALRLKQDYFAIGTLAFSSVVTALLINWKSLTRGVLGIAGIPRPEIGEWDFYQNREFLILVASVTLALQVVLWFLFRGGFGRTLRALGEFEEATASLGRNVRLNTNFCFFCSSCCAGLAGALFAYYMMYIDPSSFSLAEMVLVFSIVVVGSPGSFWGCVLATCFLILLPEALRFFDFPSSMKGHMEQVCYGAILFGVVFLNRHKLFPVQRRL